MTPADQITPLVLTYNEAPNIARTLASLQWARRVVVLDSVSTDATRDLAGGFPNVSWHTRPFDHHAAQWRFGIHETGIDTPYVLALDADHQVPAAFVAEVESRFLSGAYEGGMAGFEYRFYGHALRDSLYPPKIVLFRRDRVVVTQPGHTQEMSVPGLVYRFAASLIHDDRKPVDRFVSSQMNYAHLEAQRLTEGRGTRLIDRLRVAGLSAPVLGLYAYVRAGGPFRGAAAVRYAYERATFECLLALRVSTDRLQRSVMDDAQSAETTARAEGLPDLQAAPTPHTPKK